MAENLCNEIKRLHKRKQLPITSSSLERMQDSESSGSEMGPESPHRPDSPPSHLMRHHGDKALFTFKQVQLICEGMIKEREDQLRERYESVLTTKLAEQYDAFVKFTYDQIQRRYEAAPSCKYILAGERARQPYNLTCVPFAFPFRLVIRQPTLKYNTTILCDGGSNRNSKRKKKKKKKEKKQNNIEALIYKTTNNYILFIIYFEI